MHRRLQLDTRENTASSRQHASRLAAKTERSLNYIGKENPSVLARAGVVNEPAFSDAHAHTHAATTQAATMGKSSDDDRLLTIRDVAELLQVPVSWVYEHTRDRCANRIPGIRLGKYWRFERTDVVAWIESNRGKDYPRVG